VQRWITTATAASTGNPIAISIIEKALARAPSTAASLHRDLPPD
jgi:hypothetical protein